MPESKDKALNYIKVLVPVVIALIAGEGYHFTHTPEPSKEVIENEVDNLLIDKLHNKMDSISRALVSKEYAKGSLTSAVGRIKQFDTGAADTYLKDVFKVADDAINNHNEWIENQLPYIKSSMNKRYLCPVQDIESGDIVMQGLEGDYRVRFGKPLDMRVNGKQLDIDIPFYNDVDNRATPLKYLKKPIYK